MFELKEEADKAKRKSEVTKTAAIGTYDLRNITEQINRLAVVSTSLIDSINSLRVKIDNQDKIISEIRNSIDKSNTTETAPTSSTDQSSNDSVSTVKRKSTGDKITKETVNILCTRNDDSLLTDDGFKEVIRNMKGDINPKDFGISDIITNWTANMNVAFQIIDDDAMAKAKKLAQRMKELTPDDVKMDVFYPKTAIKITGLDLTMTDESLIETVIGSKTMDREEIKVTKSLILANGRKIAWIECPKHIEARLKSEGYLMIGKRKAVISPAPPPKKQCLKCHKYGHLQSNCTKERVKMGRCDNCGQHGRHAATCDSITTCISCKDNRKTTIIKWAHLSV